MECGTVWVNQENGLIERVETEGFGIAGKFGAVWTYDYGKNSNIEPPTSFIEKERIN